MAEHSHDHDHHHDHHQEEHDDPVNPAETTKLQAEAQAAGSTPVGYFLGKAAGSTTQKERVFWLGKVDSARYFADRQRWRDKMDQRARESMEAEERLMGTEASLALERTVGNACILKLVEGDKKPGKYSLIRRLQGEQGATGHGPPSNGQWVIQGLSNNAVHEFAVVSEDSTSAKEIQGPWLPVPIGMVSTQEIQAQKQAKAERQYRVAEEAEARKAREHSEKVALQRRKRQEQIKRQEERARKQREQIERDIARRQKEYDEGMAVIHEIAPRDMILQLRDQNLPGMTLDISFVRGTRKPQIYQFKVNGTVLGYSPDGRHSGSKPDGHIYHRSIQVPRGQITTLRVYGVNKYGDAGDEHTIDVPHNLTYGSAQGTMTCGIVGGGERGRFGYAARDFGHWGVNKKAGRFTAAQATGILAMYESSPSDGTGFVWVVSAHDRLSSVQIDGVNVPVTFITHTRGAGYLYKGKPDIWPSREERSAGIEVAVNIVK